MKKKYKVRDRNFLNIIKNNKFEMMRLNDKNRKRNKMKELMHVINLELFTHRIKEKGRYLVKLKEYNINVEIEIKDVEVDTYGMIYQFKIEKIYEMKDEEGEISKLIEE